MLMVFKMLSVTLRVIVLWIDCTALFPLDFHPTFSKCLDLGSGYLEQQSLRELMTRMNQQV